MPDRTAFHLSDQCRILTPDALGLAELCEGIAAGASITARYSDTAPIVWRQEAEPFLYCQTAGSTGFAKTIRRRPQSWIASFEVNRGGLDFDPQDVYATLGGLGHSLTLYATLEAFHLGAGLVALAGVAPRAQAQALSRHGASVLYATPTQLRLLLGGLRAAGLGSLPALRHILCGGGLLAPDLKEAIGRAFPAASLREFFGAAETSFITMTDADTPPGSVGRAYPGVALSVRPLPGAEDGSGEIWVSGPYLFDGYKSGTAPGLRRDGDAVSIGEVGRLDEAGCLFLRGRLDRMVTIADRNLHPEEVELALAQDASLPICIALPFPDPRRGHGLAVIVEGRGDAALERRIREICRVRIGAHAVPRRIHALESIPLLPAGKPDLKRIARLIGEPA